MVHNIWETLWLETFVFDLAYWHPSSLSGIECDQIMANQVKMHSPDFCCWNITISNSREK